jgi:GMP synthase-like glutamine amidotransferase
VKIGLLICDHVAIEYQDMFGDYTDMFAHLFPEFNWVHYEVTQGHFPQNLEECDAYMATGSRHSVYDDLPWINQLKAVIRALHQQSKYFIGFCFGHQLLGEALGGKVAKSPNGWSVGVHQFELYQTPDWMVPTKASINMLMMCQDQVLTLPPDTILLAGNQQCPHAIMQVGSTMMGIQGHPEFSKAYDQLLMEIRIDKMGWQLVDRGIASLQKAVDHATIRQWVLHFLNRPSLSEKGL